jgi:Protein of unknown function (DUF3035)
MRHSPVLISALVLAALSVGGCDSMKRALGLEKVVPDEFAVVSRAPLAIPPDYALRPPRPGAAPTQEVSAAEQARQSIFRASDPAAALPGADKRSDGENLLLRQAGAATASADIRQTITKESRSEGPVDQSFVDKLLFWRGPDNVLGPTDQVIDPTLEAQRLKGSQAAVNAQPTAPGLTGTPVIERTKAPVLLSTF